MRKILKCVLAFALLSMVFTSTAFAEGSVVDKPTVDGDAGSITVIGDDYTGDKADLVNGVNSEITGFASGKDLLASAPTAVAALKGADIPVDENTLMTPFYEITGPATGGSFTVTLGSSLLGKAKWVGAFHVKSDGKLEMIAADSFDKTTGVASFTTTSFSPFAFVVVNQPAVVYVPTNPSSSNKTPVVNTAAGEVNHTNYMAYAAVASVVAVGAIILASKKLAK